MCMTFDPCTDTKTRVKTNIFLVWCGQVPFQRQGMYYGPYIIIVISFINYLDIFIITI